jgi:hypothetical protein
MGAFWADAESIFETARSAGSGAPDCDLTILIGPRGEILMLEAAGWALAGLLAHHGAQTAYRVTRQCGTIRLEGKSASETCLLQSKSPAASARQLLAQAPPWHPSQDVLFGSPRGTRLLANGSPDGVETWTTCA